MKVCFSAGNEDVYALSKEGTFYQINILSHENFKSIENEDKIYRMKIYFIGRKYVLIG